MYRPYGLKYTGEYATAGISQLTSDPHPELSSPQYASGLWYLAVLSSKSASTA